MESARNGTHRVNSFALVTYIPDPLAAFLDELRRELEPSLPGPRAHVTILPPRPVDAGADPAVNQLQSQLADYGAFDLSAGEVHLFPVTNVVYLSVEQGCEPLKRLHSALNRGVLAFAEPFHYCPHITLVQGLEAGAAEKAAAVVRERWAAYTGPRAFSASALTFVQNTLDNRWLDLAEFPLHSLVR